VKLMIDYLYLGDYDPATAHEYESPSTIEERIVLASPEPDAETAFAEPDIDGTFASSLEPVELSDAISADPVADSWGGLPVVPGPVNSSFLEMHAKMFVIASKYDITPLRDEASKKLKHETKLDWQGPDLIAAMSIIFSQTPEKRAKLRNVFKGVWRSLGFKKPWLTLRVLHTICFSGRLSPSGEGVILHFLYPARWYGYT
jgi:hypothetical protein